MPFGDVQLVLRAHVAAISHYAAPSDPIQSSTKAGDVSRQVLANRRRMCSQQPYFRRRESSEDVSILRHFKLNLEALGSVIDSEHGARKPRGNITRVAGDVDPGVEDQPAKESRIRTHGRV
ncbi:hypothetical protein AAE478_007025 [Parahypoxylon ruwenzoriense]